MLIIIKNPVKCNSFFEERYNGLNPVRGKKRGRARISYAPAARKLFIKGNFLCIAFFVSLRVSSWLKLGGGFWVGHYLAYPESYNINGKMGNRKYA
jgi:hypothetical protein